MYFHYTRLWIKSKEGISRDCPLRAKKTYDIINLLFTTIKKRLSIIRSLYRMKKNRPLSKNAIAAIVLSSVFGAILVFVAVCCGFTFIPMLKMVHTNKTACSRPGAKPVRAAEVVTFDSGAKLSYFPLKGADKRKYVVICPGGGYVTCSEDSEGRAVAAEFNRLGYHAFVLRYRIGAECSGYMDPLQDLVEALGHIEGHANKYKIYSGLYALCGFSAGGNLVGMFGTEKYGYSNYEWIKKPSAIIMGYPWISPTPQKTWNPVEAIYRTTINHGGATAFLGKKYSVEDMCVNLWVTPNYPRTYIMQGDSDSVLPVEDNGDLMEKALKENGVEYVYERCHGVDHGCGIAMGTSAEGWLERAAAFEDKYWYEEEFRPDPISCEEFVKRADGVICGVCHPGDRTEKVLGMGAEWVRIDIGWPAYNKDGKPNAFYEYVKKEIEEYVEQGLKVFAVTPYPKDYAAWGYDIKDESDLLEIAKMARFFVEDLQGLVSAFQVTNEMTEPQFRAPLSTEEAAEFVGMQLKNMYRYRGNILIGYNLSATDFIPFLTCMKPYKDYCDYIGLDLYLGCFEKLTSNLGFAPAEMWVNLVWQSAQRPILFTEFGYLAAGERRSAEEKLEILRAYGAQGNTLSEAENYAKAHIKNIINNDNFPKDLRDRLDLVCGNDEEKLGKMLFGGPDVTISYAAHLYMELEEGIGLEGYPHTPEGQAKFFTDFFDNVIIPQEMICGAFMYCFSDSDRCYVCGQSDCPVETCWGALTRDGKEKPSYYALEAAFGKWRESYAYPDPKKGE